MRCLFAMSEWAMPRAADLRQPFDDPRGLTGSETSILMYAREFVRRVDEVHIVGNFVPPDNSVWEGVRVHSLSELPRLEQETWDAAFTWMDPRILKNFKQVGKKVLNQQVNDFSYCQGWESYIDVVTSPADTHRRYLQQHTSFPRDRWLLWPNAIDQTFYWPAEHVREHRLVYASSPDRALHWLLELFPLLRRRVPDVTLSIFYNWQPVYEWNKNAEHEMGCRIRYCKAMLDRLTGHGVSHRQSISKNGLIAEMRKARVLAYPCDPVNFTEGFSVTTLEALSLGCLPVIVGADALQEVYGEHVPTVKAPYAVNKHEYIDVLERALVDDKWYDVQRERALQLREVFCWDRTTPKFLQELSEISLVNP